MENNMQYPSGVEKLKTRIEEINPAMPLVEPQKDHILFTFYIPFVTLFLSYPSIKPLIFTTFIINMGL